MNKESFSFNKNHQEAMRIVREEIPKASRRKAETLAIFLTRFFIKFKATYPNSGVGIQLNEAMLKQCCIAYFDDITRLQKYHPIDITDNYKNAAFIFKWICKCRPIKLMSTHCLDYTDEYTMVNAIFAIHCALAFLQCPPPDGKQILNLMYTGTFRCIHPEQMSLLFFYMEKTCSKNVSQT